MSGTGQLRQLWEVTGGGDAGGIIVRQARDLASAAKPERLATGATVEELALEGERLSYRLRSGRGPETGWVSIRVKDKTLAVKLDGKKDGAAAGGAPESAKPKFDPYAILGICSDATDAAIKSAFRKASLKCHPDRHPDDPHAAERFRELKHAKDFLLDPMKRLFYNAKHKLIKPKVNYQWWTDWNEIFEEIDACDDELEDAEKVSPEAPLAEARIDILIVGATGLCGTVACMVLQRHQRSPFTWAIAGRDGRRLDLLKGRFGTGARFRGAFRAESPEEFDALASRARVVIEFRGPMYEVGTSLGKQCVRTGTHYLVNTADDIFSRDLRDTVHDAAREAGVCVISGAGFVAQLADFGAWYMVKHMREKHGSPTGRMDMYSHAVGTMLSGSMIATGLARDHKALKKDLRDGGGPFYLGGVRPGGERELDDDVEVPSQDPWSGLWALPAMSPEARFVRCASGLFDRSGEPYGDDFMFKSWALFPDKRSAENSLIFNEFAKRSYKQSVESGKLPPKGAGPGERLRQECFITVVLVAQAANPGEDGREPATAHCILRAGPGGMADRFEGSATLIAEAAHCVLEAVDAGIAGSLRPGWGPPTWHLAHLGYFARLVAKGFNFKILDKPPERDYFKNLLAATLPIGDDVQDVGPEPRDVG